MKDKMKKVAEKKNNKTDNIKNKKQFKNEKRTSTSVSEEREDIVIGRNAVIELLKSNRTIEV